MHRRDCRQAGDDAGAAPPSLGGADDTRQLVPRAAALHPSLPENAIREGRRWVMEHWLDQLARGLADRRLSRRQALVRGSRALAVGVLAGGGYGLATGASAAGTGGCTQSSQDCVDVANQVYADTSAACGAEDIADQPFCYAQATESAQAALFNCQRSQQLNECGPCEVCTNGSCQPYCLLSCAPCDSSSGVCLSICSEDEYCSRLGGTADQSGGCVPKCPQPCAPYDPSTGGCRDTCAQQNPCLACKQGYCQSNCPDPADFCDSDGTCKHCDSNDCRHIDSDGVCRGCDPNCEVCQNGSCVNLCTGSEICCAGRCLSCCGGYCDTPTGACVHGHPCLDGSVCCSGICQYTQSDPANCGACGHLCPRSEPVCANGACRACRADSECNGSLLKCCPTGCVNTETDPNNCGACGNVCPGGTTCEYGQCFSCGYCPEPATCCPEPGSAVGRCTNTSTDQNNCGTCGVKCQGPNPACVDGDCQPCPSGFTYCGPSDVSSSAGTCCGGPVPACCEFNDYATGAPPQEWICYDPTQNVCCENGVCPNGNTCTPGTVCCCPPGSVCCGTGSQSECARSCG